MVAGGTTTRAFAVKWKELVRWNVDYFHSARWHWPTNTLKKLADFAIPEVLTLTAGEAQARNIPIISKINFNGQLFLRSSDDYADYKGRLFLVSENRLIFSKINAKRGCIYFHAAGQKPFAVSSEYPVFKLNSDIASGEYVNLALRLGPARETLLGSASGMAKARTNAKDFLNIIIPIPTIAEQMAFVAHWRKAQDEIRSATERVKKLEDQLPFITYSELGTPPPLNEKPIGKYFVTQWANLDRWSFNYLSRFRQRLFGFTKSKFPIERLGKHLIRTMNGYCIKPVAGPTPNKMLKLNALNPNGLDLTASKFVTISDKIVEHFAIHKGDLFITQSTK